MRHELTTGSMGARGPAEILAILTEVKDPEIPFIDVVELGVVRDVVVEGDSVCVDITPTYSACPAMKVIADDIEGALRRSGFRNVVVREILSPAWTTDWLSEGTKSKMREHGIAPPGAVVAEPLISLSRSRPTVACPFCGSSNTEERSEFGSTACKAIHYCMSCQQPFDRFKTF
jgi:ring-1,2-phenylacetyl-CoA epoxidase subunit PaaD